MSVNGHSSSEIPVISGVPQGSVLGPTLFIYYINDLPLATSEEIKIFADDTKGYVPLKCCDDKPRLQNCIDSLVDWSEKWLLRFNNKKCKILHLGKNNPKYKYYIKEGDELLQLEESDCERDLGVFVDCNLNFNEHVTTTVAKARRVSGLIMRAISLKTDEIMVPLFKALIRPTLEYANAVWYPYKRMYINSLERVQRQFTKRVFGMEMLDYNQRLATLNLPSLEYRHMRGDLIETYKILTNVYDTNTTNSLFTLVDPTNSVTRNNNFKIFKKRVSLKPYQMFFTNRVINLWNGLPDKIVNATSLNSFKNAIDKHFHDLKYDTNITY